MPGVELATYCVAVTPRKIPLSRLEMGLRQATVPLIGRVSKDRLLLDPRTLEAEDFGRAARSFQEVLQEETR